MKLLVLIHEFPPIGGGGGMIARDLVGSLARRGHQLRVLTSGFGELPKRETLPESETVPGTVEIVRLNVGRKEMFRADFRSMLAFVSASTRFGLFSGKDFRPDLIHAHFAVPAGAAAFAISRLKRIPYVITVHLGDIPGASPEKTGAWFKRIYPFTLPIWKKASKMIAVSQFSRSLALQSYRVPIDVIPNGIDRTKVSAKLPIAANDPVRIVFAGRFVPQKNLTQLLRTLDALRDESWECVLIGDGEERAGLNEKIRDIGLSDRIRMTGWIEPERVIEIFRTSDILFLPSKAEGLPIVGIQALATGLALVLSNAGGNTDVVLPGRNGYVFDPEDTSGFAGAIRELIAEPAKLRAFKAASYELSESFDIETVTDAYENAFREVLRGS